MRIDLDYHYLTHHVVPGPQSLSYFVSLLLLPIALLIPRSILSRRHSIFIFVPIILAASIHAWYSIGGPDVISVDVPLWCLFLLALNDPWTDFRRIVNPQSRPSSGRIHQATFSTESLPEVPTGIPAVKANSHIGEQTALIEGPGDDEPASSAPSSDEGEDSCEIEEQSYPGSLWQRLPWVGTLLVSIRLNNWKIGSYSHDRSQPAPPAFKSRGSFLIYSIISFIRGYLVLDLTRAYISTDSYFVTTKGNPSVPINAPLPPHLPSLFRSLVPPQLFRTMIIGAQAWALISQMFYLPCLLPVLLHSLGWITDEWSPHNWPPYFGSPGTILHHGVRGFWGQYWHQTMRFSVSGPGYALASWLKLRRDGLWRYAIITLVAFGLSGIVHMGLVPPEPPHATVPVNSVRLLVAGFFWVQPIAMLVEVATARAIASNMGLNQWQAGNGLRLRITLNFIWVIVWFTICLPLIGEAGRQLGYWRVWPMPISVWKGLRGEGWLTWPFLMN
ncbi:hypothetical protein EV356DRAFT_484260 [Viridothelium virens]|uniref:Wax synthase domain-containing protein n=1 Tax=Viridothelium virens TaxID=1048519 RepID=A0A6A6HBT8_VIRVR|nr:hypothetical protein EV356DRAFT_484260 [Viridothelium virens]